MARALNEISMYGGLLQAVVSGIILYYVLLSYNFHPKEILAYSMFIIGLR